MGRCQVTPIVKTNLLKETVSRLEWFPIINKNLQAGELLACFELFPIDLSNLKTIPELPPKVGEIYRVPSEIRPELKRTMIEV